MFFREASSLQIMLCSDWNNKISHTQLSGFHYIFGSLAKRFLSQQPCFSEFDIKIIFLIVQGCWCLKVLVFLRFKCGLKTWVYCITPANNMLKWHYCNTPPEQRAVRQTLTLFSRNDTKEKEHKLAFCVQVLIVFYCNAFYIFLLTLQRRQELVAISTSETPDHSAV